MSESAALIQEKDADCLSLEESFAVVVGDKYLSGEDHNESVVNVAPTIRELAEELESLKIRLESGNGLTFIFAYCNYLFI